MKALEILAKNLTRLMEESARYKNRSQLEVASGVSARTIGSMRAGQGNPTLENIEDVARVFKLEAWELLIDHEVTKKRLIEQLLGIKSNESSPPPKRLRAVK